MGELLKHAIDTLSRESPDFKRALNVLLKYEIYTLLQRLSDTGEESVVITASVSEGTKSHLGSSKGEGFLQNTHHLDSIKDQFLHYCWGKYREKDDDSAGESGSEETVVVKTEPDESGDTQVVLSLHGDALSSPTVGVGGAAAGQRARETTTGHSQHTHRGRDNGSVHRPAERPDVSDNDRGRGAGKQASDADNQQSITGPGTSNRQLTAGSSAEIKPPVTVSSAEIPQPVARTGENFSQPVIRPVSSAVPTSLFHKAPPGQVLSDRAARPATHLRTFTDPSVYSADTQLDSATANPSHYSSDTNLSVQSRGDYSRDTVVEGVGSRTSSKRRHMSGETVLPLRHETGLPTETLDFSRANLGHSGVHGNQSHDQEDSSSSSDAVIIKTEPGVTSSAAHHLPPHNPRRRKKFRPSQVTETVSSIQAYEAQHRPDRKEVRRRSFPLQHSDVQDEEANSYFLERNDHHDNPDTEETSPRNPQYSRPPGRPRSFSSPFGSPLTNADKQRAYRERKKMRDPEGYLRKERQRVRAYYRRQKSDDSISEETRRKRREMANQYVRRYRERQKLAKRHGFNSFKMMKTDMSSPDGITQSREITPDEATSSMRIGASSMQNIPLAALLPVARRKRRGRKRKPKPPKDEEDTD